MRHAPLIAGKDKSASRAQTGGARLIIALALAGGPNGGNTQQQGQSGPSGAHPFSWTHIFDTSIVSKQAEMGIFAYAAR